MNKSLENFLTHLCLFSYFLALSPLIFLGALLGEIPYSMENFYLDALIILLAGYLGFAQRATKKYILYRLKLPIILKGGLILLSYLLTLGSVCLCCHFKYSTNLWLSLCLTFSCLMLYAKYYKSYDLHYSDIYKWELFTAILLIYIPVLLIYKVTGLTLAFIALVATYILVRNQSTLEDMLERSEGNTPMIDRIKRNNIKWLALIMSLVFIAYPFRQPIGDFLLMISKILLFIIGAILGFILRLGSVSKEEPPTESINYEQFVPHGTHLLGNEWGIVFWAVLLLLIFLLRGYIWAAIKDIFFSLRNIFLYIYRLIFKDTTNTSDKLNPLYDEVVENIEDTTELYKKIINLNKRRWKKQLKAFHKLPNSTEKYRFGFKLVLEAFRLKGLSFTPSHTVREICKAALFRKELPPINEETSTYERIRYGEGSLENEDLPQLEVIIKKLNSDL